MRPPGFVSANNWRLDTVGPVSFVAGPAGQVLQMEGTFSSQPIRGESRRRLT